jgi:proteasome lid subunit RPN8/RPN11
MLIIPALKKYEILLHTRPLAPDVACGVMAGLEDTVSRVYPAPYSAPDRLHYYEVAPYIVLQIPNGIDENALELLAVFHSHPNGFACPDPYETGHAR